MFRLLFSRYSKRKSSSMSTLICCSSSIRTPARSPTASFLRRCLDLLVDHGFVSIGVRRRLSWLRGEAERGGWLIYYAFLTWVTRLYIVLFLLKWWVDVEFDFSLSVSVISLIWRPRYGMILPRLTPSFELSNKRYAMLDIMLVLDSAIFPVGFCAGNSSMFS